MRVRRIALTFRACLSALLAALIAAEPALANTGTAVLWQDRRSAARVTALPPVPPAGPASLDDLLRSAPGRVSSVVPADSARRPTLILIQDVHLNAEAQSHIRATVANLIGSGQIGFVALEGAAGPVDLSIRDRGVVPDIFRHAVDYLLETGRVSGAVHALLTAPAPRVPTEGVEDPSLYAANVAAAADGRRRLASTEKILSRLRDALSRREKAELRPEEISFLEESRAGRSGGELSPALARRLLKAAPGSPQLQRFVEAAACETAFDGTRLENERRQLFNELLPRLDDHERSDLLADAVAFRSGSLPQKELFERLSDLTRRHGVALRRFPALDNHLRYLGLVDDIDVTELLREAESAKEKAWAALKPGAAARTFRDADRWLSLAEKLIHFGLTRDEWTRYAATRNVPALFAGQTPDLRPFENFYRLALARDARMAQEVRRLFRAHAGRSGILVAGGFHAAGLSTGLGAGAPRIVTFTPRLTRDPGAPDAYFSVFTRERTPLDRLLDGERIFLANPPARLGLLPEMELLGEENADPSTPLPDPTRRLAELRGDARETPVRSRDVSASEAQIETDRGRLTATFADGGRFRSLNWNPSPTSDNPYPQVDREITIIPPEHGEAPTVNAVYGPLFARIQAWAGDRHFERAPLFLRRTIDMRERVIYFQNSDKSEAVPVGVYAEEAARLRRFFAGYRVVVENLQGIGAAKGLLREYENVTALRSSILDDPASATGIPVSLADEVARAERLNGRRGFRVEGYSMGGPYRYHVEARVPAPRPGDFEFLETFRPLRFLRLHEGTPVQKVCRAAGLLGIWAAMLAAPVTLAGLVPAAWLSLGLAALGYFQIGTAMGLALVNPERPLSRRQKLLLFSATAPNLIATWIYGRLFRTAPLAPLGERSLSSPSKWPQVGSRAAVSRGTGDGSLVTQNTRNAYVERNVRLNRRDIEAELRLLFAPDHEFLQPFRPRRFLEEHVGTRRQQIARAVGIGVIWLAMLAVPVVVAGFIPSDAARVAVVGLAYFQTGVAYGISLADPSFNLGRRGKGLLFIPYGLNFFFHALYNAVAWGAPLTTGGSGRRGRRREPTLPVRTLLTPPDPQLEVVGVLPVYAEFGNQNLARLLGSLERQTAPKSTFELVVVVNNRPEDIHSVDWIDNQMALDAAPFLTRRAPALPAFLQTGLPPIHQQLLARAAASGLHLSFIDESTRGHRRFIGGLRNIGIRQGIADLEAVGRPDGFIANMDADTTLPPDFIDRIRAYRPTKAAIVYSVPRPVFGGGSEILFRTHFSQSVRQLLVSLTEHLYPDGSRYAGGPQITARASYLKTTGGFGETTDMGEDVEFSYNARHRRDVVHDASMTVGQQDRARAAGYEAQQRWETLELIESGVYNEREVFQSGARRFPRAEMLVRLLRDVPLNQARAINPFFELLGVPLDWARWQATEPAGAEDGALPYLRVESYFKTMGFPLYGPPLAGILDFVAGVVTARAPNEGAHFHRRFQAAIQREERSRRAFRAQIRAQLGATAAPEPPLRYADDGADRAFTEEWFQRALGEARTHGTNAMRFLTRRYPDWLGPVRNSPDRLTTAALLAFIRFLHTGFHYPKELPVWHRILTAVHGERIALDDSIPIGSASDPGLMTSETKLAYMIMTGRAVDGYGYLVFAPDYEFLQVFRPVWFWRSHVGTRRQQMARALGIGVIWLAMLATPLLLAWLMPNDALRLAAVAIGYFQIGTALGLGLSAPARQLASWQKALLFSAYAPNFFVHALYNALVWFAPLTAERPEEKPEVAQAPETDTSATQSTAPDTAAPLALPEPGEEALRAWAAALQNQRVPFTIEQIRDAAGTGWNKTRTIVHGAGIVTAGRMSRGRTVMETWAEQHRGEAIEENARILSKRFGVKRSVAHVVLQKYKIVSGGHQKSQGEKNLDAYLATVAGQTLAESKRALAARFSVTPRIVSGAAAAANVTLIDPERQAAERARATFRAWIEARRGTKLDRTIPDLASDHGVSESLVKDLTAKFNVETTGIRKSPDRLRLEAWLAPRRGTTVPETSTDLQIAYKLSPPTVEEAVREFNVTLTKGKRGSGAARAAARKFRAWAKERHGQTLDISAPELGLTFGLASALIAKIARSEKIVLKKIYHAEAPKPAEETPVTTAAPVEVVSDKEANIVPHEAPAVAAPVEENAEPAAAEPGAAAPAKKSRVKPAFLQDPPATTELPKHLGPVQRRQKKPKAPRSRPGQSFGDYIGRFENQTITETPEQLAQRFDIPEFMVYTMLRNLNIKYPGGPLITEATRLAYARRNEAQGRAGSEADLRLRFAPDYEFLQAFRPVRFWRSHVGTRRQQMARALGIGVIWLAMLATPLFLAWLMPNDPLRLTAVAIGYSQLGTAFGLGLSTPTRQLAPWQKALLFSAYAPNFFVHALYNAIVGFAPLTMSSPEQRTIQAVLDWNPALNERLLGAAAATVAPFLKAEFERRARSRGLDLPSYAELVESNAPGANDERRALGELLWDMRDDNDGVTAFFREAAKWQAVEYFEQVVRRKWAAHVASDAPLKIRVAMPAASEGAEAFSLGIILHKVLADLHRDVSGGSAGFRAWLSRWDVRLLAADVALPGFLVAQKARYAGLSKFLEHLTSLGVAASDVIRRAGKETFVVRRHLRQWIDYRFLNLNRSEHQADLLADDVDAFFALNLFFHMTQTAASDLMNLMLRPNRDGTRRLLVWGADAQMFSAVLTGNGRVIPYASAFETVAFYSGWDLASDEHVEQRLYLRPLERSGLLADGLLPLESQNTFVRAALEEALGRLRSAWAAQPAGEERIERTLAHLWLRPTSGTGRDLSAWHHSLLKAIDEAIFRDVAVTDLDSLQKLRIEAQQPLRAARIPGIEPSPRVQRVTIPASSAAYYVNPVRAGRTGINMASVPTGADEPLGIRLMYEVQNGVMLISEIQKQGNKDFNVPAEVTAELLRRTIDAARAAGLRAVVLPTAGEQLDVHPGMSAYAAHVNYARVPWQLGFRLDAVGGTDSNHAAKIHFTGVMWVITLTPAPAETVQERIDRELHEVRGLLYYPAGGSDWKPFRDLLPRMPHAHIAVYVDREYADAAPDVPYQKERRARYLLKQQGFGVDEIPGPKPPDRVFVRPASGPARWRLEFYRGDVMAGDVRSLLPRGAVERRGGVGLLHVERPGEGGSLSTMPNAPQFHARQIMQVNANGLLSGYQAPTEEPFLFLTDFYALIGLERIGEDASGQKFFKKIAMVDEATIAQIIRLDRELERIYEAVRFPYAVRWIPPMSGELQSLLAQLGALSPEAEGMVRAKFAQAFTTINNTHYGGRDMFRLPVRFVGVALLFTLALLEPALLSSMEYRLVFAAAGILESFLAAGPLLTPLRRAWEARRSRARLGARARLLVRAARELAVSGGRVTDQTLNDLLAHAATTEGVAQRRETANADDWPATLSDPGFPAALDRAVHFEGLPGLTREAAASLVMTLSAWGLPIDGNALGRAHLVIKINGAADLTRVTRIERRLRGVSILLWADARTAADLHRENLRWPVAAYGDDVFDGSSMKLRNVATNLPLTLRNNPDDLVFVLPPGFVIDDTGVAAGSAWRRVRLLFIDQVLGLLRVISLEQRKLLDRVLDHLIVGRQA